MLIYITGVPGTGKSTVCDELASRGYRVVDADDGDLCSWVSRDTGETLAEPPAFSARTPQFYEHHVWRYEPNKVGQTAAACPDSVCFVGGFALGVEEILHLFARTFFLGVRADELVRRLLSRTNGPFADSSESQRAAQVQRVLSYREMCEKAWRRDGFALVDSTEPVAAVVDDLLTRCDLLLNNPSDAL